MPKYEKCDHYGDCPCITCDNEGCYGCLGHENEGYAVDTDKLCEKARVYCESGRADSGTAQA